MAEPKPLLAVEVVYAEPGRCWRWRGSMPAGSTVAEALSECRVAEVFPAADLEHGVGVFGSLVSGERPLRDGDRIEVYRPLTCDPMEARRRRAGAEPRRRR